MDETSSVHGSMRLSLICFSLITFTTALQAATVIGSVNVVTDSKHASPKSRSLTDIVVWLRPLSPMSLSLQNAEVSHATLLQKDKMFHPHVLAVRVGSVVDFPNADPIFHNAFSNYDGQIFDVSLYPPGTSRSVRFRRPGIVRVFCNIHPLMSAVIVVLETPYFTKLDANGRFRIEGVPPGGYELQSFDERMTGTAPPSPVVTVRASDATVSVKPIEMSEAGYIDVPHRNKYGQPYPVKSPADYGLPPG